MSKIRWKSLIVAISHQTSYFKIGLPGGSAGKESAFSAGDASLIPGLAKSGEWKGDPLQYPGLENSMKLYSTKELMLLNCTEEYS